MNFRKSLFFRTDRSNITWSLLGFKGISIKNVAAYAFPRWDDTKSAMIASRIRDTDSGEAIAERRIKCSSCENRCLRWRENFSLASEKERNFRSAVRTFPSRDNSTKIARKIFFSYKTSNEYIRHCSLEWIITELSSLKLF